MNNSCQVAMEKQSICEFVRDVCELCKVRLSAFIGLSALCGYLIYRPVFSVSVLYMAWAVFVLSCGCSGLNNVQDRKKDGWYDRTRKRALPDRRLSPGFALTQSILLMIMGIVMLRHASMSPLPMWLGLFSIILYNGLYAPMKSLGLISAIPGVLCGMIPPLIGWSAATGGVPDMRILSLMLVFGFWLLPHMGMQTLSHSEDNGDHGKKGLLFHVSDKNLKRIVVFWIINFSLMMICLVFQDVLISSASRFLVVFHAVFLSMACLIKLRKSGPALYRELFGYINASLMWVMVLIVSERMILFA